MNLNIIYIMDDFFSVKEKNVNSKISNKIKVEGKEIESQIDEDRNAEIILLDLKAKIGSNIILQSKKENPIYKMVQKMKKNNKNALQLYSLTLIQTLLMKKKGDKDVMVSNKDNQKEERVNIKNKLESKEIILQNNKIILKNNSQNNKNTFIEEKKKKLKDHFANAYFNIYIQEHPEYILLKLKTIKRITTLVDNEIPILFSPILYSNSLLLDKESKYIDDIFESQRFKDIVNKKQIFGINSITKIQFNPLTKLTNNINTYKIKFKTKKQPAILLPKTVPLCENQINSQEISDIKPPSEINHSFTVEPENIGPKYNELVSMIKLFQQQDYKVQNDIQLKENLNIIDIIEDVKLEIDEENEEENEEMEELEEEEIQTIPYKYNNIEQQNTKEEIIQLQTKEIVLPNINECEIIGGFENYTSDLQPMEIDTNCIQEIKKNITSFSYQNSNIKNLFDFVFNILDTLKTKHKEFENEYLSISKNQEQIKIHIETLKRNICADTQEKANKIISIIEIIKLVLSTLIESLIDKKHFLQRNQIENNDKKEKEIQNNKKQIGEMKTELKLTEEEIQNKENIISQKETILNQRNNDYETLQKQISFVKIVIENINKDSNEFNNDFKYLEKLIKDKQSNEPMISVERKNEIKRILYLKEKEKIINDCDFKIKSLNANIKLYANKIKNIKIQIDNLLSGASIGNKKFYVEQTSSTIIKVNYILFLFIILLVIIYFTMKQIV